MSRPLEPFQNSLTMNQLAQDIKRWAAELGFQQTGITDTRLQEHVSYLEKWLARHFHGTMSFMQRNTELRAQPDKLLDSTLRVISVRMDYHPKNSEDSFRVLENPQLGYVSRYANGRDYHKLMRKRLQQLADRIRNHIGEFNYRAFVDSAPVLEKALAEKAGLGWIGKHTNLVNSKNGSWFFLGELYTNLPLPMDEPAVNHCGSCNACIKACPTKAIVNPYQVDARRCISYLTIEHHGAIPVEFREAMGNRIYGCDDCQLVCPFNKFMNTSKEDDFEPRHGLDRENLLALFQISEDEFNNKMQGSAIRRIGYEKWMRNIAIALGNAPTEKNIVEVLRGRLGAVSDMVDEHIHWALARHHSD